MSITPDNMDTLYEVWQVLFDKCCLTGAVWQVLFDMCCLTSAVWQVLFAYIYVFTIGQQL